MTGKIKVGIFGASGRLGKAIASEVILNDAFVLGPLLVHPHSPHIGSDLGVLLGRFPLKKYLKAEPTEIPDIWIDVSIASGFENRLKFFEMQKNPLVIGTTGLSQEEVQKIEILSSKIPVFYAPNFSLGMALMQKFAREAALYFPLSSHIDLIEKHHSKKKDAPSGSAIQIAKAIQMAAPQRSPIPIHSIRSGQVVGEHTLLFNTGDEQFEIGHKIENRKVFALGALQAAIFIRSCTPGLYSMENLCSCCSKCPD